MSETKLANSVSSGGGGHHLEAHYQAMFLVLMLTGGYAPCLPTWPIVELKLQGKVDGWETDDLVITVEHPTRGQRRRLLGQVRRTVSVTNGNRAFARTIHAAWRDFNNPRLFTKGDDVLALMTGPLSGVDAESVPWVLGHARATSSVDQYMRDVGTANFSPSRAKQKLEVIRYHLRTLNDGDDVQDEELYSFLKHFHLLSSDLGGEYGITLPLLHSHMSQFANVDIAKWLWGRAVDVVQSWNQAAGTLTPGTIPDDLVRAFDMITPERIPEQFALRTSRPSAKNLGQHSSFLALLSFVGEWNENNEDDFGTVAGVTETDGPALSERLKEIVHLPDAPLTVRGGVWRISDKADLLESAGSYVTDRDLERILEYATSVLREPNPAFDMRPEERFLAPVAGMSLTHSPVLRRGLAEGVALLGTRFQALPNCSAGRAQATAGRIVHQVLSGADWKLWATLDGLLPSLAEAAPEQFLGAIERVLKHDESPFDELLRQQGRGSWGTDNLMGWLWALEALAWDETYLIRACDVLAQLAERASGTMWADRPVDSIASILLPWFPQTEASIEKRKTTVQMLVDEYEGIAWDVIIRLLPHHQQVSSGTYRSKWRLDLPDRRKIDVPKEEYWDQVSFYSELALRIAANDARRLAELVGEFPRIRGVSESWLGQLLEVLSDESLLQIPKRDRLFLWRTLQKTVAKHRKYADVHWAMDESHLTVLDGIVAKLSPADPVALHQPLFSSGAIDLFDPSLSWDERVNALEERRQAALREIFEANGIEGILTFVDSTQWPPDVGKSLAIVAETEDEMDAGLLPSLLSDGETNVVDFIAAYVLTRSYRIGWAWTDEIVHGWSTGDKLKFLRHLPFTGEAWKRAARWLGEAQHLYWEQTNASPFQVEGLMQPAVDQLLDHGRPRAALNCFARMLHANEPIIADQCVEALIAATTSEEPLYELDPHQIVSLIRMLQEREDVSEERLYEVEWMYLEILDGHYGGFPRHLHRRLADDPQFFCDIIQILYRSDKDDGRHGAGDDVESGVGAESQVFSDGVDTPEQAGDVSGQDGDEKDTSMDSNDALTGAERANASNAWELLHHWSIVPGTGEDGTFDTIVFQSWLGRVCEICTESGHVKAALVKLGEVLIYAPADPDGLWLHRAVAAALNMNEAEAMRSGFRTALFNSRGVHFVDASGAPERHLAEQYHQQAEDIENAGYHRLAATLRALSEQYRRDADRVVERYGD